MALTVVLWCAAAALLLSALPIQVRVVVERERALRSRVQLAWLFGLVRVRLHPRAARAPSPPDEERPKRGRERRRIRMARRASRALLLRPELRARAIRFLRDVLRALRPRDLRLSARIGTGDPADTGRLWGVLGPLAALLASRPVSIEPDFEEACLRFRAAARVRLIPAQLAVLTLAFLASPAVLRALVAR